MRIPLQGRVIGFSLCPLAFYLLSLLKFTFLFESQVTQKHRDHCSVHWFTLQRVAVVKQDQAKAGIGLPHWWQH